MDKKLKLRRHESFSIRDGWIEKGLRSVKQYDQKTFSKDSGIKILGLGSNMVKSLKYWMTACGLIEGVNPIKTTEFADILYSNDSYLNDTFSWWLIHYMLVTNEDESPVLYHVFNRYKGRFIDKESLFDEMCNYFDSKGYEYNSKMLSEDCQMFFRLYYNNDKNTNPEDNFTSPLAKLHLLDKTAGNDTFVKRGTSIESLSYLIVFYALEQLFDKSFDITDAFNIEMSPAKVFNMDRSVFEQFLGVMRNKNLVTINKTAGLNMVYFEKKMTLNDVVEEYRKEGGYAI